MITEKNIYFVIPIFDIDPTEIINSISAIFTSPNIILVVDNPNFEFKTKNGVQVIKNKQNIGLAKSLQVGYKRAIHDGAKVIVKADPDLEYPIESSTEIINKVLKCEIDGGFVHFPRKISDVSFADFLFHKCFSLIEGRFLRLPLTQHSPGLQVYSAIKMRGILEKYQEHIKHTNIVWGGDLLFLKLAKDEGLRIEGYKINRNWVEKRKLKKILRQSINTLTIINNYKETI